MCRIRGQSVLPTDILTRKFDILSNLSRDVVETCAPEDMFQGLNSLANEIYQSVC